MIWFGSSAGVAISNMYPEAKSVGLWLRHGWFVAVSYIVGFFVMFAIVGWNPDAPHKKRVELDTNYHQAAVAHPEGQPRADRMSAIGPSRHLAAAQQFGRIWRPSGRCPKWSLWNGAFNGGRAALRLSKQHRNC